MGRDEVTPLVLDTNALIWLREGSSELGDRAKALTDKALYRGDLYVSTISFWEVGMLVAKRRMEIMGSVWSWRDRIIADGAKEIPISGPIAIASTEFGEGLPADPADRIIVATAMTIGGSLLTSDVPLLRWDSELVRHDARR